MNFVGNIGTVIKESDEVRQTQTKAQGEQLPSIVKYLSDIAKKFYGYGTSLKPAYEPVIVARKPISGTVADNVMTYGVGG